MAGDTGVPLSKLGILIAQLESIVASASLKPPDPLICFDMLSDLLSTIQEEPKESIILCQRKGEDVLQALLLLGARPPVRRLAAKALVDIIGKGDSISIYSRASSLQGWLADSRKADPSSYIGAAYCLGALYRSYGQKITSGLTETSIIVAKLIKFPEVGVREAALQLIQNAVEGSGGGGAFMAYTEALRIVLRVGAMDRAPVVRAMAAQCLRAFAMTGGPGVGPGGLENCAALCVKALEDPSQLVSDSFAAALGALLALGLNPEAQVQPRGKAHIAPAKTLEGGLQKHLIGPFMQAIGPHFKSFRVGLTMAWVAFLQGMRLTYFHSDLELQSFALQAMSMVTFNSKSTIEAHSQACVLYILRVGIVEQMSEPAQKDFLNLLTKQLSLADTSASMLVVILRTVSHLLVTLGEVCSASCEALENSLVATLSNSSMAVRVEAALTMCVLAQVDPECANSLMSCGVTTLWALRETVAIEKGDRLRFELDSLHGQAVMLAALLAKSPKLPLGVPSRLPTAIFEVAKRMVSEQGRNALSVGAEKEAGWLLIAAIVSSMPKEELKEQEFDVIALWTVPFGGNFEDRLRKAEDNLAAEICVWSTAVEALTAFVKNYVVPNLSPEKEGILLQPILGYLSGALTYLSSPILQQAPLGLRQTIDLFAVRTLTAYSALPDPVSYKSDHSKLLALCTNPFRDPFSWAESSSLRQLLDNRDASLGPWVPGRDSFEDELRAFEGGSDGPLPCVWENEICVFPQPLSVATSLVNYMLLCFGIVFAVQTDVKKLQLLDLIDSSAKYGKKQIWHGSNMTNICVALLAGLKCYLRLQTALGIRSMDPESEVLKRMQSVFQGILADELSCTAHRRAAAEGIGLLARLGSDVFAARLMRTLLTDAEVALNLNHKGSIAVALGCIHRSVGGMALSVLVPATVQTLCTMARDPKDSLHIWSLHSLWLTADAAGLSYVPYVQATMSLVMEILLSEEHAGPELRQSIGRLVNAIVAVIGPELSPGSSFFIRCKSVVSEISSREEPAALLESVLFAQQLVLFAPQAVSVHAHVHTLKPTLSSRQPSLRQAAVSTLRHLAEWDPVSMGDERIEEYLFAMLDTETDARIINIVRLTLVRLLEAACPSCPFRWLSLCRNVVLASSTTMAAGGSFPEVEDVPSGHSQDADNDAAFIDDDKGMIYRNNKGHQSIASMNYLGVSDSSSKDEQLPRYQTRVFAAECLSCLPTAVGGNSIHFNLSHAKESVSSMKSQGTIDWLVLHLGDLVAVAYQIATGIFESIRPLGIMLLDTILVKFGATEDPDYMDHLLLEQYQAQFVSALRTALDSSAGPRLLDAGLHLAARMVTSGIANGDSGVLSRVLGLLSRPLSSLKDLQYPSYSEWVGCKVQVSLLAAHAAVKVHAYCCTKTCSAKAEGLILLRLLDEQFSKLSHRWVGLLKDCILLQFFSPSQLQTRYMPFLEGVLLPAVALIIQPYLNDVWPIVLNAVAVDVGPASISPAFISLGGLAIKHYAKSSLFTQMQVMALGETEFFQLWTLCVLALCNNASQTVNVFRSLNSIRILPFASCVGKMPVATDSQQAALFALSALCNEGFYQPHMLAEDLCYELVKVLLFVALKEEIPVTNSIIAVTEQVAKHSPDSYIQMEDMMQAMIELCMYYIHQVIDSVVSRVSVTWGDMDNVLCSTLQIVGNLIALFSAERQIQLSLSLLYTGVKIATVAPMAGNSLSAAMGFITNVANLLVKQLVDISPQDKCRATQQSSLLFGVVESLAQLCTQLITKCNKSHNNLEDVTFKLRLVLGSVVTIAQILPEIPIKHSNEETPLTYKDAALKRSIGCLHSVLTDNQALVQLAGLQYLRTLAQASINEQACSEDHAWTLFLMKELSADILLVVYNSIQVPLTTIIGTVVGESLKLLLLLHSLVEGDNAQKEVLYLLLPAIIASGSTNDRSQVGTGLEGVAVKLVTHLASVPESSSQFKTVLLELPIELQHKLQDIIRASVAQQRPSLSLSAPMPISAQKLAIPEKFLSTKVSVIPVNSTEASLQQNSPMSYKNKEENEDEGEDWDEFQSHPVSISSDNVQYDRQDLSVVEATCSVNSTTLDNSDMSDEEDKI